MNRHPVNGDLIVIDGREELCISHEQLAAGTSTMLVFSTINLSSLGKINPKVFNYSVRGYVEVDDHKVIDLADITFVEQFTLKKKTETVYSVK